MLLHGIENRVEEEQWRRGFPDAQTRVYGGAVQKVFVPHHTLGINYIAVFFFLVIFFFYIAFVCSDAATNSHKYRMILLACGDTHRKSRLTSHTEPSAVSA